MTTHIFATFAMSGLSLMVHVVSYPLFRFVSPEAFGDFHSAHATRITWIVGPLMLAEVATAAALACIDQRALWWGCLALSTFCFVCTGLLAVPQHNALGRGWSVDAHARLVRTNIWRTLAWLGHSGLLGFWLLNALSSRPLPP